MNLSPYVKFTNEYGLSSVRVRKWHPAWFIPIMKLQIRYWLELWDRYKSYQRALSSIYDFLIFEADDLNKKQIINLIRNDLQSIYCGYECDYNPPYGFVPEAGCPIHDV